MKKYVMILVIVFVLFACVENTYREKVDIETLIKELKILPENTLFALAPDGKLIVDKVAIWHNGLDSFNAISTTDPDKVITIEFDTTDRAYSFDSWSPDSTIMLYTAIEAPMRCAVRWIYITEIANDELSKTSVFDIKNVFGDSECISLAWSPDNQYLAIADQDRIAIIDRKGELLKVLSPAVSWREISEIWWKNNKLYITLYNSQYAWSNGDILSVMDPFGDGTIRNLFETSPFYIYGFNEYGTKVLVASESSDGEHEILIREFDLVQEKFTSEIRISGYLFHLEIRNQEGYSAFLVDPKDEMNLGERELWLYDWHNSVAVYRGKAVYIMGYWEKFNGYLIEVQRGKDHQLQIFKTDQ